MGNKTETGKRAYLRYTLWFLITGAFVFGWFAVSGKSMVWKFDGVYQHFNTLVYYGKYLRKILHSLFVEHKFCVPMWDMSIGYGADILTTLNYYAVGDPLTLLSVLVPGSLTEYLYAALIILRFYLQQPLPLIAAIIRMKEPGFYLDLWFMHFPDSPYSAESDIRIL